MTQSEQSDSEHVWVVASPYGGVGGRRVVAVCRLAVTAYEIAEGFPQAEVSAFPLDRAVEGTRS